MPLAERFCGCAARCAATAAPRRKGSSINISERLRLEPPRARQSLENQGKFLSERQAFPHIGRHSRIQISK